MESDDGAGAKFDTVETLPVSSRRIDTIPPRTQSSEFDFSIHVMEDGTQASTKDRVCKGN